MEEKQLSGICIGVKPWKENDKMLTVFCEDGCVYSVLARGALKPKYKLKFAAQLFSACDYFLCESRAGYYILGGATFGEVSFLAVASRPESYAAACVVCEIAAKSTLAENKRMYAETLAALGELCADSANGGAVVLRMLLAAFASSGFGTYKFGGAKGEICDKVLGAPLGGVSELGIESDSVYALVKSYASKFASQFGKLDSLPFFLGEEIIHKN